MSLDTAFIESVISGKVMLPRMNEYHFFLEVQKVVAKARSDNRFKEIKEDAFNIFQLDDGMYFIDNQSVKSLVFKLGKEVAVFRESDDILDMRGTCGCRVVIDKYFNTHPDTTGLIKGRMMKSYFHYFEDPRAKVSIHGQTKKITVEEFEELRVLFKTLELTEFETEEAISDWLEKTDTNEMSSIVIAWEDLYSLHVHRDAHNGFNVIAALKGNVGYLNLTYANTQSDYLDFGSFYKEIHGMEMPDQIKRIIASCFT